MRSNTYELPRPDLIIERALIGSDWLDGTARLQVTDPATGHVIAHVPDLGATETRAAIEAASVAWPIWRKRPAAERAAVLLAWHSLIVEHRESLARIITAEQGKPLFESRAEIDYAASFVSWFAGEAVRIEGGILAPPSADRRILVLREPVGVCAAITPWNFPAAMITRKVAPALAAGCTMVLKPSEMTPLTALALASLGQEAGVPAGVLSIVTGNPRTIGGEMTGNPLVRKLSFTGSTAVGRTLMRQCADDTKRLSLELGGNAPFIVFNDASLEEAIAGVMASKFRNAGQTCVCANRILVQDEIHDEFVAALSKKVEALRVGNGFEPGTTTGPLISPAAVEKFKTHVNDAQTLGAELISIAPDVPKLASYGAPTLLIGITSSMRLTQEETFGPLAAVQRFSNDDEAIVLANATSSGLAAYFYTTNIRRAWRISEALECGIVGLNTGTVSIETVPFGGVKHSGIGREGGREGIDEYLETKAVHWGGVQ